MSKLLLALETSTRYLQAALLDRSGRVEAHAKTIPEEPRPLAEVVAEVATGRWSDVGAYAIGVGPGSFTGLRVGLAFLKGLAAIRPRPVVPVSSLEAWAQSLDDVAHRDGARWVLVDARRGRVWIAGYRPTAEGRMEPIRREGHATVADARAELASRAPGRAAGTAAAELAEPLGWHAASDVPAPSAVHLGRIAIAAWCAGATTEARAVAPNYLMLSAAEEKLRDGSEGAAER